MRESLQAMAADQSGKAVTTLKLKGAAGDLDAYRTFLVELADRTAKAAKEGSFLGFGGERLSEGERNVIARMPAELLLGFIEQTGANPMFVLTGKGPKYQGD
jgi:hypothetical protein